MLVPQSRKLGHRKDTTAPLDKVALLDSTAPDTKEPVDLTARNEGNSRN